MAILNGMRMDDIQCQATRSMETLLKNAVDESIGAMVYFSTLCHQSRLPLSPLELLNHRMKTPPDDLKYFSDGLSVHNMVECRGRAIARYLKHSGHQP